MGGKPFTQLTDALSFIERAKNQPAVIKDLYFCLSFQAKTGLARNGEPTALRKRENAVALKAIWLDIDCNKEPPKGYRCKKDGLQALKEFCEATQTPYPNAIIDSGNGFHVYWISDKPLSPAEWRAYAEGLDALATGHGLLHDSITTDAARVLRLPGTSNNKQVPPKPVVIKLLEADFSFASPLSHLLKANAEEHAPARPRKRAGGKDVEDIVVDPAALKGGPAAVFGELPPDEFRRDEYDFPPLPFKPIQEGCSWFDTLPPELKDEVVDHGFEFIARNTKLLELEAEGGNNAEYFKLTTSVARSGAPHAEDIFVKYASTANNADPEDELRQHFLRCRDSDLPEFGGITVGTLIGLAQQSGANFDPWKRKRRR